MGVCHFSSREFTLPPPSSRADSQNRFAANKKQLYVCGIAGVLFSPAGTACPTSYFFANYSLKEEGVGGGGRGGHIVVAHGSQHGVVLGGCVFASALPPPLALKNVKMY